MLFTHSLLPRLLQVATLILLTATLSACAGRPKPLNPDRTVNVTSVRVVSQSTIDAGFASRLEQRLEATVGRATRDVGQETRLEIIVRDRRSSGPLGAVGKSRRAATLDIELRDAGSGNLLETKTIRASGAAGKSASVQGRLIAHLVSDIRSLLGLSGYAPHPVAGLKRPVVRPKHRPVEQVEPTEEQLMADPLLNGMVTPTTVNLKADAEPEPTIDLSKPLLSSAPAEDADGTPATSDAARVEPAAGTSAEPARVSTPSVEAEPDDEPCIITIDNDCSDPDGR